MLRLQDRVSPYKIIFVRTIFFCFCLLSADRVFSVEQQSDRTAIDLLQEASRITGQASQEKSGILLGYFMLDVATAQLRANDAIGARQTLERLRSIVSSQGSDNTSLLVGMAEAYARLGDVLTAHQQVRAIPSTLSQSHGYTKVAAQLAALKKWDEARQTIKLISDPFWRETALEEMVRSHLKNDDFTNAQAVATLMSPSFLAVSSHLAIAKKLIEKNDKNEAKKKLDLAFQLALSIKGALDPLGIFTGENTLGIVAQAYARFGLPSDAQKVALELRKICTEKKTKDLEPNPICLHEKTGYAATAIGFAEAGDLFSAKKSLEKAHGSSFAIFALKEIAVAEARAGHYDDSINSAQNLDDEYMRDDVLLDIVDIALSQGMKSQIPPLANSIKSNELRGRALLGLALILVEERRLDAADAMTEEAIKLLKGSMNHAQRHDVLATTVAVKRYISKDQAMVLMERLDRGQRWLAFLRGSRLLADMQRMPEAIEFARMATNFELAEERPNRQSIAAGMRERTRLGDRSGAIKDAMNVADPQLRAHALFGIAQGEWLEPKFPLQTPRLKPLR